MTGCHSNTNQREHWGPLRGHSTHNSEGSRKKDLLDVLRKAQSAWRANLTYGLRLTGTDYETGEARTKHGRGARGRPPSGRAHNRS
jgi:hypothetical protein